MSYNGTMSRPAWIYAVHADDGTVVYIGQTNDLPAKRYRTHVSDAMRGSVTPFHEWLRGRLYAGTVPRVSTVERTTPERLDEREQAWIAHYGSVFSGSLLNRAGTQRGKWPPLGYDRIPADHVCDKRCKIGLRKPCATCGKEGTYHSHNIPCWTHLNSRRHRAAVAERA